MNSLQSFFILLFCLTFNYCTDKRDSFLIEPESWEFENPAFPAPGWLEHAVIAEIPIRAFNISHIDSSDSWSNKYGKATYFSVIEKVEWLRLFGVNVLCLYSVYDHTPGTNLYAIRHHEASKELGGIDGITSLIEAAHQLGFKVISNTNHYGVDQTSPMISDHPDWFIDPKHDLYGQRIFDLNNPKVIDYIIDQHVYWCTEVGLDGWRIDIAHETYRKYIWDPILQRCSDQGKRILLATEGNHLYGHVRGAGWNNYPISTDLERPLKNWAKPHAPYGTLRGFDNISQDDPYRIKDISSHNSTVPCPFNFDPNKCPREGAYQIKGSRFLFGHNLLFAPFVPWMMPGDLFDATHYVVPGVMKHRLKGKLLHAYLDWNDTIPAQGVIKDFTRIAQIRKSYPQLFHNNWHKTNLINVPYSSDIMEASIPYARYMPNELAAIIIGNSSSDHDKQFLLDIPLHQMGFAENINLTIKNLWTEELSKHKATDLSIKVTVPKDNAPGGGIRVLILETSNG